MEYSVFPKINQLLPIWSAHFTIAPRYMLQLKERLMITSTIVLPSSLVAQ